jgi:cell division septation protein DedD
MVATETDLERYADPQAFAREVNLPLLGVARIAPVPSGAGLTALLSASAGDALSTVVDGLAETRQSLTLRTLLLAGFPHDPECFAVGLALGREWSRRGLRVAIVDLDFWNPTVWRPGSHPNEGFIDVLEYGCSIGRVAWEIVADHLWLIGPGSHPPDEERIVEHPDWPRATRVLAMHADVTLFVAPLLDRRGFTGKLSKRVDGALLVASVERTARADLRDAFLELWGSDAPMIGCVGIESVPALRTATHRAGSTAVAPSEPSIAAPPPSIAAPPRPVTPMAATPVARAARAAPVLDSPHSPAGVVTPNASEPVLSPEERALEQELEREVRRGVVKRPPIPGIGKAAIWVAVAGMIAVGIGIFRLVQTPGLGPESGAVIQSQPAGEEAIRPPANQTPQTPPIQSGLGNDNPGGLSAAAPPSSGASRVSPPKGSPSVATRSEGDASLPFCVHVASFKSVEKVREIVRSLAMKGLDAWYEPATDMPGWYRVFVGRFANEAEAKAYAGYLLDNHFVDRASSFPTPAR